MFRGPQEDGFLCGPDANLWIDKLFRDCVYTPWETVAFFIGLSSVLFWLVCLCPQVISNFLRGSADALSPWFLVQWLAGDTFNLLGCLLTGDQLATETITAFYFIFADCLVISQYTYYQFQNRNKPLEIYCSDSDDSLHKPSFGYHVIAKNSVNPAAATYLDQATHSREGTPKISSQQLYSGCHHGYTTCIQSGCKLKPTLVPEKWAERSLYQDGSNHITPEAESWKPALSQVPNPANRCSCHSGVKIQPEQAIRLNKNSPSKGSQFQASDARHFLRSRMDSKQQCALMYDECHRLRRVVLEYGLEYGPPAVSRRIGLHAPKVDEVHVGIKLGHRKLPVPRTKAQLRAVLCLAGIVVLSSSSWHSLSSSHATDLDAGHGFVLGRRALKSLVEETQFSYPWRHFSNWTVLNILSLDTSLTAFTGRKLMSLDNSSLWWTQQLGRLLGWISSVLYLGSRVSQLIKNKQRRSAEGLSLAMLTCAVVANLTYGASILMRASSWEDFMGKAPWLAGSLGTVSLDLTLFIQAQYLNRHCKKGKLSEHTPLLA